MAATKATKKKPQKKVAAQLQSPTVAASRLTWALALTFALLSLVFVAQAVCYYA